MRDATAPHRRFRPAMWMLLPAVGFLLGLMLYPVSQLLLLSLQTKAGAWTGANYERLAAGAVYWRVLGITLRCAAWTTALSVVFSYPVAYLIATSTDRVRARLTFWVMLPFWTSFLVRTFAWIVLLGRNGVFNQWLQAIGLTGAPLPMLYSFPAVMVGMLHALMPLCVITMISVMESIDGNLSKAALTLGAPRGSTFWRIYFPLSLPGVAAGGLLVFISSLGFFITPALLGSPREIMLPQIIIQQVQELLNWPFAGALSVLLIVAVLVVFTGYDRVFGISSLAGTTAAGAGRPAGRVTRFGRMLLAGLGRASDLLGQALAGLQPRFRGAPPRGTRRMLWVAGLCALVFLALPAFLMIPVSFTTRSVLDWPPRGFGVSWYQAYLGSGAWLAATGRSFEVALLTAVLAMALGTPAAFGLSRGVRRGNGLILGLLLSPLIVPRIIIAVALFYLYAKLRLVGTTLGLVLGHTILAIPYVVVTMMAVLKTYDQRYDNAAWSLGANRLRALWHVTLPLLRAGLIAAFLFAFVTSFDELTIALFVTGGLETTLPKMMWDSAVLQVDPTLAAVSTLLLLLITCILLLAGWIGRRDRAVRG
ncbi:MAG TPA: ABC transporter permease subunit [Stellaceae bacterium]|nr:ABC transporter permease subunit [Stellaceae bacterium]